MLLSGLGSVRMGKNCDLGLENAALGLRPRAAFSRPRSQFFPIRTSQLANNIYFLLQWLHKNPCNFVLVLNGLEPRQLRLQGFVWSHWRKGQYLIPKLHYIDFWQVGILHHVCSEYLSKSHNFKNSFFCDVTRRYSMSCVVLTYMWLGLGTFKHSTYFIILSIKWQKYHQLKTLKWNLRSRLDFDPTTLHGLARCSNLCTTYRDTLWRVSGDSYFTLALCRVSSGSEVRSRRVVGGTQDFFFFLGGGGGLSWCYFHHLVFFILLIQSIAKVILSLHWSHATYNVCLVVYEYNDTVGINRYYWQEPICYFFEIETHSFKFTKHVSDDQHPLSVANTSEPLGLLDF